MRLPSLRTLFVLSVVGLAAVLSACPKKQKKLQTGKAFAKAWRAEYRQFFDDEVDPRRLVHLRSDEPFLLKEYKLLEGRVRHADIVLEGNVVNVAHMERWDGSRRLAALVKVTRMIRGARKDLPEGKETVSLFLTPNHPEINSKEIVGKSGVVFMRWRPKGQKPPFSWHMNFVCAEIYKNIDELLKKRAERELKK